MRCMGLVTERDTERQVSSQVSSGPPKWELMLTAPRAREILGETQVLVASKAGDPNTVGVLHRQSYTPPCQALSWSVCTGENMKAKNEGACPCPVPIPGMR